MRFIIHIQALADGWEIQVTDPTSGLALTDEAGQPHVRRMRRVEIDGQVFPVPPIDEVALLSAGAAHLDLCQPNEAKLCETFADIMGRQPGKDGVERFGRYLFDTLLGASVWKRISQVASKEPIELALMWDDDHGPAINRLPWEMMHSGKTFLASEPLVAITRRVRGQSAAPPTLDQPGPPRVLFVVGSTLTNDSIRPGAEYLDLLRTISHHKLSLGVKTQLLLHASPEKLEQAIKAFQPSIVHMICHGGFDAEGEPYLELMDEQNEYKKRLVRSANLLQLLGAADELPRVMVLNACYTATVSETQIKLAGQVVSPLAVTLVRQGIPMVIGMAGEVSDQACRLFARRFYEALLHGDEIIQAAAKGRRGGIIAHSSVAPSSSVDWALPTMVLDERLEQAQLSYSVPSAIQSWHSAAGSYAPRDYPALCGRAEIFSWYNLLMADEQLQRTIAPGGQGPFQILAITVNQADNVNPADPTPRYGRTRLLQAFAAQAARDGHIPVILEQIKGQDAPKDLKGLLKGLIFAATGSAKLLGIPWKWTYLPALFNLKQGDDLPATFPSDVREELEQVYIFKDPSDINVIATAFRLDLLALLAAGRQERPSDAHQIRLLLLVDDVHRLGFEAARDLLNGLLNNFGLGGSQIQVRIVLSYALRSVVGQEQTLSAITEWNNLVRVRTILLGPFQPSEDRMAYKHFLLNWREANLKDGKPMPLALSASVAEESIKLLFKRLERTIKGIPSNLESPDVQEEVEEILIDWPQTPLGQVLYRASDDDEQLLKRLAEDWQRGEL